LYVSGGRRDYLERETSLLDYIMSFIQQIRFTWVSRRNERTSRIWTPENQALAAGKSPSHLFSQLRRANGDGDDDEYWRLGSLINQAQVS
jgi:hypothetical protein